MEQSESFKGSSGVLLSDQERERLRTMLTDLGERDALDRLKVSRNPFYRCLAGLPVRRGTALLVRHGLDLLEAQP